jgi:hypothetical protein
LIIILGYFPDDDAGSFLLLHKPAFIKNRPDIVIGYDFTLVRPDEVRNLSATIPFGDPARVFELLDFGIIKILALAEWLVKSLTVKGAAVKRDAEQQFFFGNPAASGISIAFSHRAAFISPACGERGIVSGML